MRTIQLQEGNITWESGCFTFEQHISGMTIEEIGRELGLPPSRLVKGAWVVFALKLPHFDQFDLGGWTEFSTDNFMVKEVIGDEMIWVWNRMAYEKTYRGKRLPVSIFEAKAGYMQQMSHRKLVKVVPAIRHDDSHQYPSGGRAPQIIINQKRPLRCQVLKYLPAGSGERFRTW